MKKTQIKKVLKELEDDEKYYGDFGKQFLSNSDIKSLLENPDEFHQKQEGNPNLIKGAYFHTLVLEPDKLHRYKLIESSTRNTNTYKELSGGEMCLLQKEADELELLRDRLMTNTAAKDLIIDVDVEYEVPGVIKLADEWWKCKTDIKNNTQGLIVDLKTTSDLLNFDRSARNYNYDSQAFIYSSYFNMDFIFLVIDKKSKKIGIFDCSPQFLQRGKDKVEQAAEAYRLHHKNDDFNMDEYFISKTL